jgi:uncharacterized membrane protein YkoI
MLTVSLAFAAETKIKRSDLPPAVEKTVQAQSTGATIKGFSKEVEDGQVEYEVEIIVNEHGKDVSIAKDGTVLEIEEEVEQSSLPAAVKSALRGRAKGARITKVESVTRKGKIVSYEATVMNGTRKSEVAVGPNGEKLAHAD